jgi:hypothetical protein
MITSNHSGSRALAREPGLYARRQDEWTPDFLAALGLGMAEQAAHAHAPTVSATGMSDHIRGRSPWNFWSSNF